MDQPRVTVAVPSLNQGRFLDHALESIFTQDVPVEVFVADGGSIDDSVDIIKRWEHRLLGWRSGPDAGQSAAINEAIAKGSAPFVCWLNSDDWLLPGALTTLTFALSQHPQAPMAYGRTWNMKQVTGSKSATWVRPFSEWCMAQLCIVSQPGSLIRRTSWEALGGLDGEMHMAMDYDMWWRMYKQCGQPHFVDHFVAVNRVHAETKTSSQRYRHYQEAMTVVRKHYGRVPIKWWLAQPYAVWWRAALNRLERWN
jgi:glycosyltransferase involved in cell wall biosynthesis